MAASTTGASDPTLLSTWRRDFRLSLVLVVAGIVTVVGLLEFTAWANSTGNYPTSFWSGLAVTVAEAAGGILILLGGTVAYYHWSGLRQIRRDS